MFAFGKETNAVTLPNSKEELQHYFLCVTAKSRAVCPFQVLNHNHRDACCGLYSSVDLHTVCATIIIKQHNLQSEANQKLFQILCKHFPDGSLKVAEWWKPLISQM